MRLAVLPWVGLIAVAFCQMMCRPGMAEASSPWSEEQCSWVAATLHPCLTANTVLSQLTAMEESACCEVVTAFHSGGCFCLIPSEGSTVKQGIEKELLVKLAGVLESCTWRRPICDDAEAASEAKDWSQIAAFTADSQARALASTVPEDDSVLLTNVEGEAMPAAALESYHGSQGPRTARLSLSSPGNLDMAVEVQQNGGDLQQLQQTVDELGQWMTETAMIERRAQQQAEAKQQSMSVLTSILGQVVDLTRVVSARRRAQVQINMEISVETTRTRRNALPAGTRSLYTNIEGECNCFFSQAKKLLWEEPMLFITFSVAALALCLLCLAGKQSKTERHAGSDDAAPQSFPEVLVAAQKVVQSDLRTPLLEADGRERRSSAVSF